SGRTLLRTNRRNPLCVPWGTRWHGFLAVSYLTILCANQSDPSQPMKPAITSLQIRNFLSFGDSTSLIPLEALNILIGPNGSGKSNFIGVIGLLKGIPRGILSIR